MAFFASKMSPARAIGLAGGLALAAGLALSGCGSSPPASADATGKLSSCDTETRAIPYMANLTRRSDSGAFTAVLVDSVPGPPIKGSNDWTVRIVDAGGAPIDGLTVTAAPKMPDHVHPTSVLPVVTAKGGGVYDLAPVYLFMPGYWVVTLTLQPASGPSDTVTFPVCIPS
jgi:hypothetical protein